MFTTRHADRIDLRPLGVAAAAATLVLSSTIALAALNPFGFGQSTRDQVTFSANVIASARLWELQRVQESPYYIDWPMRSASQWEDQRLQQSPYAG